METARAREMQDDFHFKVIALIIASIGLAIVPFLFVCLIIFARNQARADRKFGDQRRENNRRTP